MLQLFGRRGWSLCKAIAVGLVIRPRLPRLPIDSVVVVKMGKWKGLKTEVQYLNAHTQLAEGRRCKRTVNRPGKP